MNSQQQVARAALLWGTVFGFVLFGVDYLVSLVLPRLIQTGGLSFRTYSLLSLAVGIVIGLIVFFVAGLLAGRQARSVAAGTFVGLIAAAIRNIIGIIVAFATLTIQFHLPPQALASFFISDLIYLVVDLGLGAGIGALGGLAGRASAGGAPVVVAYAPPGYYPGGMPAYPPPPAGPYPQGPYYPTAQPPYPYPNQPPPQAEAMTPPEGNPGRL